MEPLIPFYPDINTFTLQPPIENLVVPPDSLARKTPEEIEAACEKIRSRSKTAKDIGMFGQNPFLSELAKRTDKTELSLSLPGADRPARLNQLNIELSAITLLEDLHPESDHEDRRVYKVSVAGEIMVLKLYEPSDDGQYHKEPFTPEPFFKGECRAYAQLKQSSAYLSGTFPKCYGWVHLKPIRGVRPAVAKDKRSNIFGDPFWDFQPRNGTLLQYFPNATPVTVQNATVDLGNQAMKAIYQIHTAHVKHGDICPGNMLIIDGCRVVFIDFELAATTVSRHINRRRLWEELARTWYWFFEILLPRQQAGVQRFW